MTHDRPRHPQDDVPTQPDDDPRSPMEYLRVVMEKQLYPNVDLDADEPAGHETDQSLLILDELHHGPNEPRRVRLRLQHPDSTVSVTYNLSPALTLRDMDTYLRGMIRGQRGEIDRKADHIGDEGGS